MISIAVVATVPILLSVARHSQACELKRRQSRAQLALSQTHFEKESSLAAARHTEQSALAWKQFHAEQAMSTSIARLMAMRDMWTMRQQLNDAILFVGGVMVAALFGGLCQSRTPASAPEWLIIAHALCSGTSILTLSMSLVFGFRTQQRMGSFDVNTSTVYICGQRHEDFESFYDCHGRRLSSAALFLFYVGALTALGSAVTLLSSKLIATYQDDVAAAILAVIVSVAASAFVIVLVLRRHTWR